jgi:hypothetical protein
MHKTILLLASAWAVFCPFRAQAQIAMVHATPCGPATFPGSTCTIPATGAGNLLVVGFAPLHGSAPNITSITDNTGDSYVSGNARSIITSSTSITDIWYSKNVKTGTTTVTITPDASVSAAAVIWEFSGVDPVAPLVGSAVVNDGASASTTSGPTVAASANSVVVAVMTPMVPPVGIHSGNPFTNDSLLYSVGWAHLITPTAGNFAPQWDLSSANTYSASAVAFKAAGSFSPCDLNTDASVNAVDVQLAVNMYLGTSACTANIEGANVCTAAVVQDVLNTALGSACPVVVTPPISHSATLTWVASTSPNVTGYNVYRGSNSGGPYSKLNSSLVSATTYTDNTVQAGLNYFYVLTAVNSSNLEGAFSTQAQTSIPTP